MKRITIIALFLAAATAWGADAPIEEISCIYTVSDQGGFRLVPSTTLRVLRAVSVGGGFALPADAPPSVTALNCIRTSAVPTADDKAVVDTGINMYIHATFASGKPTVSLKKVDGKYVLAVTNGRLSRADRKIVENAVAQMNIPQLDTGK